MTRWVSIILFAVAAVTGCSPARPATPAVPSICWSDNLAGFMPIWQREAAQRFDDPVVFICHGGDFHGHWGFYADHPNRTVSAEAVIQTLCSAYPGRPIVVVACNEEKFTLRAPRHGVYYARNTVYMFPPSDVLGLFCPRNCVNSINDFVEAGVE